MKRTSRIVVYILTGFVSFFIFLYFSFPYQVLKESLVSRVSAASGLNLFVDKFSPSFPFGLNLEKIEVSVPGGKTASIGELHLSISTLSLLWGRVNVSLNIMQDKGSLDLFVGLSLFDLISSGGAGIVVPRRIIAEAKEFPLSDLAQLYFSKQIKDPSTNVMVKPLFEKISLGGKLNMDVDFSVDVKEFNQSSGFGKIAMNQLTLNFDPSMQIPSQSFSSAVIKASFDKGVLKFDKSSELKSPDLDVSISGEIVAAGNIDKSKIQSAIQVTLLGELKDNLSFVLDAVTSDTTNGRLMVDINGPVLSPQISMKPF